MQFKSTKYYLTKLIKDGHKWQYTNINGLEKKPRFYFTRFQFLLLVISVFATYALKRGFNNDFISYVIAALSICVGLFLTLIISVFDKFVALKLPEVKKQIITDSGSLPDREKGGLIQKKNFFIQFTALTAYSIILSIFCIILLSISLLWSELSIDYSKYVFVGWKAIDGESSMLFVMIVIVYVHRFITIYFLMDFLLIVLYAVSGIYNYFAIEYSRIRLTEDDIQNWNTLLGNGPPLDLKSILCATPFTRKKHQTSTTCTNHRGIHGTV